MSFLQMHVRCVPRLTPLAHSIPESPCGKTVSHGMTLAESESEAVQVVEQGDPSLQAHCMCALGGWLVQQGTAKEAGKEILLKAAALLEPPRAPTPKVEELSTSLSAVPDGAVVGISAQDKLDANDQAEMTGAPDSPQMEAGVLQAANLDLLMRIYTLLATAANTRQIQSGFAIKAQACGVSLLLRSTGNTEDSKAADTASVSVCPDWLAFELTQPMVDKLSSTTDKMFYSQASIAWPELTLRCIDQLMIVLEDLYLHTLAIPLCCLKQLLAEAVLHSPALASACQLKLAALAEALVLPEAAARAEQKAGPLQLSAAQTEQCDKTIAMQEYMTGGHEEAGLTSSPRRSRKKGRSHGGRPESRAALSSRGSNHPTNRALSSRGSTATGSTPTGAGARLASGRALQPYCDAEAWMQQGEYLALRGSYGPAKELLLPALHHFQAFGSASASARCLLSLAQLERLVNQPEAALLLLQQLQQASPNVATCSRAVQCYAGLCMQQSTAGSSDAVLAVQSAAETMEKLSVEQGSLAVEAKHAAASLWMQLGWLYAKQQQPPSAESDTPAVAANPDKAVQCFQQAALACQPFGERNLSMELSASPLHVEAAMAEANVLLNGQQSTDLPQIAAAHRALELLQAAEVDAQHIHQEALISSPAQSQPQAAPSTAPIPQAPAQTPTPQPSAVASSAILPSARLLCRAQVAKAEGLVACAAAPQNQQEASASYALPGRDAAVVKQFLAQAGVLEPGSVPGFFEEEAIACASSALQLSSLPGDQCQAHLALGKAQVALYHLKVGGGQAAADLAWPGASEGGVTPNAVRGTDTVKAQEVQKAAVCSLQACITTAVQAGKASTAVAAAEQVAACLGRSEAQAAAEAILMAQSARAVGDLEALYRDAAAPQAQEQLLLQLRDHLETNPVLTASHQRLQTKLRQETCMGPRLALNPPVLDILKAIPATTCIISLHLSSEHGSVLYCAVLRGQQAGDTGPAGKTKAAKQAAEAKPDAVESPMLARVPLPRGALAAVAAQLKQYTSAREQHLLAVADQAATAASTVATEDTHAQQWQSVLDSLAALLGPAAPLLSAPPAAQGVPKGGPQSCPVLLLLDAQLVDLPFEWLPQLKSASAVVRDFSLHVHYGRMTAAASGRQGVAIKQLSYIVDPCMEHAPPPPLTPPVSTPAKPGPKPTKPMPANTPAEKASRSLVQAFQQDVLPAFGKEWSGITGNASFMPTEAQYAQLLRRAVGFVYCGMGPFLQYVPAAVLAQADLQACELAVLLDTGHTTKSDKRRMLSDR
ncbi:hypothetical protein ABBQ38_008299 [Trebouxia sp. C0009 RCD-2024]